MKLNYSRQVTCIGSIRLVFGKALIFTARKRSLGQGNIFIPFTGRGSASVHAGIPHPHSLLGPGTYPGADPTPPDQAPPPPSSRPPWDRAPPRSRPPQEQSMLGDTVNERAVRIILECNLVYFAKGGGGKLVRPENCQSRVAQAKFPVDEG